MSLRDVLIDDSWTPSIRSVLNSNMEIELIYYYFSDTSTNISRYSDFARDFIDEVDARLDIDFVESSSNDGTAIDLYIFDDDGRDFLGSCAIYSRFITTETFLSNGESLDYNRNTFVREFGRALGLVDPEYDDRWDQDDTAMSYNSNDSGDYRTSFAPEDWSALESLWDVEDFILVGDSNANTLLAQEGEVHADSIRGWGGSDTLKGFGGKDTLFGGQGDDLIYGGYGRDDLRGQLGNDTIRGSAGGDYIQGGEGSDDIYAGSGKDTVIGGAGADTIRGGGGPNDIDAGNDSSRDDIYVFADVHNNGRTDNGSYVDVLRNIDSLDRIYIFASSPTGTLGFSEDGNQINIFHNGAHEASVLGSGLSVEEVRAITSIA